MVVASGWFECVGMTYSSMSESQGWRTYQSARPNTVDTRRSHNITCLEGTVQQNGAFVSSANACRSQAPPHSNEQHLATDHSPDIHSYPSSYSTRSKRTETWRTNADHTRLSTTPSFAADRDWHRGCCAGNLEFHYASCPSL